MCCLCLCCLCLPSSPALALDISQRAPEAHGIHACNPQIPSQGIEEKGASAKGKEREKDSEKGVEEATFGLDVWPPENPDLEARKGCKIVTLNFPRASDTPRDGSPTSALRHHETPYKHKFLRTLKKIVSAMFRRPEPSG